MKHISWCTTIWSSKYCITIHKECIDILQYRYVLQTPTNSNEILSTNWNTNSFEVQMCDLILWTKILSWSFICDIKALTFVRELCMLLYHFREGRVMGVLEVSRSIGDGRFKHCGIINTPDIVKCPLGDNDWWACIVPHTPSVFYKCQGKKSFGSCLTNYTAITCSHLTL